jgi:hypothetical protein
MTFFFPYLCDMSICVYLGMRQMRGFKIGHLKTNNSGCVVGVVRSAGRSNRQHTLLRYCRCHRFHQWLVFTFCNGFMEYSIGTGGFVRRRWQKIWFIGGLSGIDDRKGLRRVMIEAFGDE